MGAAIKDMSHFFYKIDFRNSGFGFILENQQVELEEKDKTILSPKEELEESMSLNEQLTKQNKKLIKQTEKLQLQIVELQNSET